MNKHSSVPAPFVALFALAVVGAAASPAFAASLTRSVDLDAGPDEVWSVIGSFCAIADWHPAVGSCTLDGRSPPTRTLVTRDGRSTFVELEVARNDEARLYSYAFIGRPFPRRALHRHPSRGGPPGRRLEGDLARRLRARARQDAGGQRRLRRHL